MVTTYSAEALVKVAATKLGSVAVRLGVPADAVDGVVPRLVVEPSAAEQIGSTLAWASSEGLRVFVRGGGTKLGWGSPPSSIDLVLSTTRLNTVVAHRYGDLTATVQGGALLDHVNRELGQRGQWIPLDPPNSDRATIGGILATNDSGSRRHRYGAPRDLIIGMTLARPDGHLVKAGGIVVKNVAGYDLSRLLTGSFGCLAVIVTATFKLAPIAPASRTVLVDLPSLNRFGPFVADVLYKQFAPTAVELQFPSPRVLICFESVEPAAEQQAADAVKLAEGHGGMAQVLSHDQEAALWRDHVKRPWEKEGTVIKLSIVPGDLSTTLAWLEDETHASGLTYELAGRAGVGVLYLRLDGAPDAQVKLVTALRDRLPEGRGSAMVVRADSEFRALVDVWGPIGSGLRIMQEVKRRFDPMNILNPGRGPGGL